MQGLHSTWCLVPFTCYNIYVATLSPFPQSRGDSPGS